MTSIAHLSRRFVGSLSRAEPSTADIAWVHSLLLPREAALWDRMAVQDRRHSIEVARRFAHIRPAASPSEMAGALLHDVGKQVAGLGTFARVAATVVGPRTERLRRYHDHEALGAALLDDAGSDPATIELVRGRGSAAADLRAADDI